MPNDLFPEAQSIEIDLGEEAATQKAIHNLSGAAFIGDYLYLANDEGRKLIVLKRADPASRRYTLRKAHSIRELFKLEGEIDPGNEFDLEAMSVAGTRLWLIGSHAMGHPKVVDGDFAFLDLKRERNRLLFASIDTECGKLKPESGRHIPIRPVDIGPIAGLTHTTDFLDSLRKAGPPANGFLREIAALAGDTAITAANVGWFAPYTLASTKENGLDIEGLAVRILADDAGRCVAFVGLRGPVVKDFALIVEVELREDGNRGLKLQGDPRFHFLDLGGFGVRDLEWRGDDLLILAGPTMKHQGESELFRWHGAAIAAGAAITVVNKDNLKSVGRLSMRPDGGGPEVITSTAPGSSRLMLLRDGIEGPRLVNDQGERSDNGPLYYAEVYEV